MKHKEKWDPCGINGPPQSCRYDSPLTHPDLSSPLNPLLNLPSSHRFSSVLATVNTAFRPLTCPPLSRPIVPYRALGSQRASISSGIEIQSVAQIIISVEEGLRKRSGGEGSREKVLFGFGLKIGVLSLKSDAVCSFQTRNISPSHRGNSCSDTTLSEYEPARDACFL